MASFVEASLTRRPSMKLSATLKTATAVHSLEFSRAKSWKWLLLDCASVHQLFHQLFRLPVPCDPRIIISIFIRLVPFSSTRSRSFVHELSSLVCYRRGEARHWSVYRWASGTFPFHVASKSLSTPVVGRIRSVTRNNGSRDDVTLW